MVVDTDNPTLDEDLQRLARLLDRKVSVLRDAAMVGVVIESVALPAGVYSKPCTDVLLQTTIQYPASAMDMFWVDTDLTLADGRIPAGGESMEAHFGRTWRRYSWHRNATWTPGRDDLITHFEFAFARLLRPE